MVGPNVLEMYAWVDRAACLREVRAGRALSEWWFPERGDANGPEARQARAVCQVCEVREECLAWAVRHFEEGIWGGVGARARRDLRTGERLLRCVACDDVFVSSSRRPSVTRCGLCRREQARARKREWDAKNRRENPGSRPESSLDAGHGVYAKYVKGCRCQACRRAAREYRRELRAQQTLDRVFGTDT